MISFFVGVPGSGKTYFAVDKIYNNFSTDKEAVKDKKATYEICYTNINEFKFDKLDNTYYLDFDDLKTKLTNLHKMYKDKCTDEDLIEKCKEYNIYNALFVIDEAHNYFDVKDSVLIWWLSYHRHLFHEIILITQNLALIESKYKSFSEFFYKAFPQSLTLFKTHFKYNVYCSSRMAQNSKSGTIKIKRNKKVFELYKSGDSINSQNIVLKILGFAFFFIFLLIVTIYYYSNSLKASSDSAPEPQKQADKNLDFISKPVTNKSSVSVPAPAPGVELNIYQDKKYFLFKCSKNICVNDFTSIPLQFLNKLIKTNEIKLLYIEKTSKNISIFYLQCSSDFYNFINPKGVTNDSFNDNPADSSTIFTSKQ